MAKITVVNNQDELYKVINQKKSEGYLETELAVISKRLQVAHLVTVCLVYLQVKMEKKQYYLVMI